MNERVRAHLAAYAESKDWPTDDDILIEIVRDWGVRKNYTWIARRRWWMEFEIVVEINGMLIGFVDANANRDESPEELGFEFDPTTIREMRAAEVVVTAYLPVAEE